MTSIEPMVRCEHLVVGYGGRGILPPIDLTIEPGSFWAVIGRNGAGKTTWMRSVLDLLPVVSGRISKTPGVGLAYVPQRLALDPIIPLRVTDVVAMGAERGLSFLRPPGRARRRRVESALEDIGIGELRNSPFRELSEGQKQKALLARAVAAEPDVVFLDEPTATMDVVAEREVLGTIDALRKRHGTAVVIVAHHLRAVAEYAEQVLVVHRDIGSVVVGDPAKVFADEAFQRRYGDMAHDLVGGPFQ